MYDTSADNQKVLRELNLKNKVKEMLSKYIGDRSEQDHYLRTGNIYLQYTGRSKNSFDNCLGYLLHCLIGCSEYTEDGLLNDFGRETYASAAELISRRSSATDSLISEWRYCVSDEMQGDHTALIVCDAVSRLENAGKNKFTDEDKEYYGGLYLKTLDLFFNHCSRKAPATGDLKVFPLMKRMQSAIYRVFNDYWDEDYLKSAGEISDRNFVSLLMCRRDDAGTDILRVQFTKDAGTGLYYMSESWYYDHVWGSSYVFFTPQFKTADREVILDRIDKALGLNSREDEKRYTLKVNEYFTFYNTGFFVSDDKKINIRL